jgi:alpha-L-fucosidase
MPAEVDVSIRSGWFYHAAEDDKVRGPENLLKIYYESVGRGAVLLLNLPPDRRGRIHENDIRSLREFRRILDAMFSANFAKGAQATANNARGGDAAHTGVEDSTFAAASALDGRKDTYWCTDDAVTTAELVVALPGPATFNVVGLREYLPLGQRVDAFALDQWKDGKWQEFAAGQGIGNRRLWSGPSVTTDKVRLRITQASACPAISELALHAGPKA